MALLQPSRPLRATALSLEPLETRILLATLIEDLGTVTDPASAVVLNDVSLDLGDKRAYTFSLDQEAQLHVSLSDLQPVIVPGLVVDAELVIFPGSSLNTNLSIASKVFGLGELIVTLPAGGYIVELNGLFGRFDLMLHADTALGEISSGGSSLSATVGRDLGMLSTTNGVDVTEFVAIDPRVIDVVDTYFFDVTKQGDVRFTVDAGVTNTGAIDFTLFRDFDQDGIFQFNTGEQLFTRLDVRPGQSRIVSVTLPPARYGLVFKSAPFTPPIPELPADASNYRWRTVFSVPDGAGNTLGTARNAGTVGNALVTFNDYLSSSDVNDVYRFTTVAGGPFAFEGTVSGMAPGSNFELDFIRDLDADGNIDSNEVVSSVRTGNANDDVRFSYAAPGTYFVRVRRTAGEGVYTLQFANRNTDLAGNTLPTARNFGTLFGFVEFNDSVSSNDTTDIYRFSLTRSAELRAQLSGLPTGANASLSLIRDIDGDGVIDVGETLASSNNASNANENIAINLAAGTYFAGIARVAGSPTYNLRLVQDSVNETLAGALSLSPNGGGNLDFLGPEDDTDVYRFTLGSTRHMGISVGLNNEPLAVRLGRDINNNGLLDGAELQIDKILGAGAGELQRLNLAAGTYFLVLNAVIQDEGTTYGVTLFNETPDNAGNSLADARDIGTLGATQIFNDFVGDGSLDLMDDLDDFYRFRLGVNGPFRLVSSIIVQTPQNPQTFARLELIRDANGNRRVDAGELRAGVNVVSSFTSFPLNTVLSDPGEYFVRVTRLAGQPTYSLNLRAVSLDTAGNQLGTALNLGTLTTATVNTSGHFVGRVDVQDFFRLAVGAPGELRASLSGATESLDVEVVRDADGDGNLDIGETLASSAAFVGANDVLNGVLLPVAGTYFVRVVTNGGDSAFALGLTLSNQLPLDVPLLISATAPTQIKSVRFDRGGEGVSYHDTTAGNNGDQPAFRAGENIDVDVSNTIDTPSTGRRVTNTAPGEFLEYTIFVAETGIYDFDARVSSPDLGATFHLEIDGVSVNSPVGIPDTNSSDNMVSIAVASNALLTAGPHILRVAIDTGTGVNNNFAGSFNFILVRPASTGTFELSPQHTVVNAGDRTKLALAWTVPVGGWRVLNQMDLRLRDDQGRMIWFRWDEASNTIRRYNQATGKFGPAKAIGSYAVLAGPWANLYLRTTTVVAAGAAAPTVILTLDVKFKHSARGHYVVETAASDDLGHNDPFQSAGTLHVV